MSKDVALPRNRLAGGWPILDLMDSSGDTWRSSLASLPAQSVGLVLPYCVGTSQVSPQYLFGGGLWDCANLAIPPSLPQGGLLGSPPRRAAKMLW